MSKINKKPKLFQGKKSRKLLRKEKRLEKKKRKLEYYVNRTKPGKFVQAPKPSEDSEKNVHKKVKAGKETKKPSEVDRHTKEILNEKKKQQKLERQMKQQRKKQLKEANLDEDKVIKRLEKDLKLNKRKSKSIPKSFTTDGLDYLLEACDSENLKNLMSSEQQFVDGDDDFEEDFTLITGKKLKSKEKKDNLKEESEVYEENEDEFFAQKPKIKKLLKKTQENFSDEEFDENDNDILSDEEILSKKKQKKLKPQKKIQEVFSDEELESSDDVSSNEEMLSSRNKKKLTNKNSRKKIQEFSDKFEENDDVSSDEDIPRKNTNKLKNKKSQKKTEEFSDEELEENNENVSSNKEKLRKNEKELKNKKSQKKIQKDVSDEEVEESDDISSDTEMLARKNRRKMKNKKSPKKTREEFSSEIEESDEDISLDEDLLSRQHQQKLKNKKLKNKIQEEFSDEQEQDVSSDEEIFSRKETKVKFDAENKIDFDGEDLSDQSDENNEDSDTENSDNKSYSKVKNKRQRKNKRNTESSGSSDKNKNKTQDFEEELHKKSKKRKEDDDLSESSDEIITEKTKKKRDKHIDDVGKLEDEKSKKRKVDETKSSGKRTKKRNKQNKKQKFDFEDSHEDKSYDSEDLSEASNQKGKKVEKINFEESDEDMDVDSEQDNEEMKPGETQKKIKNKKKSQRDLEESNEEDSFVENEEESEKDEGIWEDIYGRKRTKDGNVIQETHGKYIPPALRAQTDSKRAEKLTRLKKQLKGLLNRLAESNMHSISSQIEELYMNNSRNDMNETLTQLIFESLISPVATPERLLLEHVMLITILHANVGTEVGANFLLNVVKKFDELLKMNQAVENKQLDNTVHIIAQLYNFKVFQAQLLYEILAQLADRFEEKHVECILLVLKSVGFSLRKDDPIALKQIILDLQKKATTIHDDNSRVKFMLDILLAIKNNNVTKIPNYDTTYSEHLKKVIKGFVRKGNYVTQLNISLEDLLKADERGKWWVVGSAWTGMEEKKQDKEEQRVETQTYSKKLLELARKQRMNTDTRRNIFCILMSAEDYLDAFEKLLHLGLKNQQEREIIHVILHCCLQEKNFNQYYALLAQKFCEYDRKYQMTIRCSIWDKLKALTNCSGPQLSNLAKLLIHLFVQQGLPISTLKVIEFGELDKITLRFMRQVLLGILLHKDEECCLTVFNRVANKPELKLLRDSLRLFIHHFLLRNLKEGLIDETQKELLTQRAQTVERLLITSEKGSKLF